MRILFVSEHLILDSHTGEVIEGLKNNSEYLCLIDYKQEYLRLGKRKFEKKITQTLINNNINLIIVNLGNSRVLDPLYISKISNELKIKVVILFPDPEHIFESHDRYYAQAADVCWVSNTGAGGLFRLYGSTVYEKFGLSVNYRFYENTEKLFDISFVGSIKRGDREKYINFLKEKKLRFFIAGYQTEIGELTSKDKDLVIQQSWIHLNFSKVENKDLNIFKRVRQYKGRIHESCMLGTLPLTEYYSGIENQFPEDYKEISFSTKEEMYEKISNFLEDKKRILDIAKKLKKSAINEYEINVVVRELLELVENKKFENKEMLLDKHFLISFMSQRYYYIGRYIAKLKIDAMYDEVCFLAKNVKYVCWSEFCFQIARGIYHSIKY